jgi:hypothetical protein
VGRIFGGYKVLENVDLELGAAQTSNVNIIFQLYRALALLIPAPQVLA